MEEIIKEVVMQPKKKSHICNGFALVLAKLKHAPKWCDGVIKYNQEYVSVNIKDKSGKYNFHDCLKCHKYIKTHKLDLV